MPRVSEAHLEQRRQQILDAARACFIRKGFHETSMQDIFAEAGLSAGAVYRYFKSKTEIVESISSEAISMMGGALYEIVAEHPPPPPEEAMERLMAHMLENGESYLNSFTLAPQVWSLAMHDSGYRNNIANVLRPVHALWTTYAENLRDAGMLPPDSDPEAVSRTLLALVPGFMLQRVILGGISPETLRDGLYALRHSTAATDSSS
ncbi:TetR/AcrR family transcriptional regulator [Actinomadura sp. NBRC 104425]|uniref:TetR/AcrR family transcriptional regulator n=1 Tax=Actinomadura sp. NBRC 104425 TaxID=3032204 RepID=UPI002554E766|nr:TetR/AcrR family transcriptional regulator [Actinomadura sp. NBRC 104425]